MLSVPERLPRGSLVSVQDVDQPSPTKGSKPQKKEIKKSLFFSALKLFLMKQSMENQKNKMKNKGSKIKEEITRKNILTWWKG